MTLGPLLLFVACSRDIVGTNTDDAPPADDTASPARPALPVLEDVADEDPAALVDQFNLTAAPKVHEVGGEEVEGYAYNGRWPGPVLRAGVGDTVRVHLQNDLADPTSLHWHGVAVPNAIDGVAWVTDPLGAGAGTDLEFTATHAGTFWVHPHVDTARQVDLGLAAMFVVTDPADPPVDDLALVFDAANEAESGEGAADDHTPPDPARLTWTVSGAIDPIWTLAAGTTTRVRLLNVSNTSYLALDWPGATWIGGDQGLLAAPLPATALVLAPGDRADLEVPSGGGLVDVTTALWSAAGGAAYGEPRRLLSVDGGETAPETPPVWPFAGVAPTPDPGTTDLVYVFQGGAAGEDWLINGEAWPDVTPAHVGLGLDVVVEVRNLSATSHPFHLHGHRFEVLSVDGEAPPFKREEDTIDVPIRSVLRLFLHADNPGRWAVHCHLLGHEEGGMMTELDVDP